MMKLSHEIASAFIQVTKVVEVSVLMPPGEYYITDPCYCFNHDTWTELGDSIRWWEDEEKPVVEFRGRPLLSFSTAHGDGCFTDNDGQEYGVDAGMIGLVPVSIAEKEPHHTLARRVTFTKKTRCSRSSDGVLRFGQFTIKTDSDD